MQFVPTQEQQDALMFYRTANDLVIEAAAGSGKTSTLELMARYAPQRRGIYLAFNKAISLAAQERFRGTGVVPMTVHGLAIRQVRHLFPAHRLDAMGRFTPYGVIASRIGVDAPLTVGGQTVPRERVTRCAQDTVKAFCASVDSELTLAHVVLPRTLNVSDQARDEFRAHVLDLAQTIWLDWMSPDGTLPIQHDTYLKAWQLTGPKINADFITLDEAQDADGLMTSVLLNQDCQKIFVGDEAQSIYGWRGATNAMHALPNANRAQLSQSFRFGEDIAAEAQKWLDLLGANMRIRGNPAKAASVGETVHRPDAIICRTNAGAITEVLEALERDLKVGISGERKTKELVKLARGAVELKEKGRTKHEDLSSFGSWEELADYAKTDDGAEFSSFVGLVNRFSGTKLVRAIEKCDTVGADVVVATAHVAKGMEWDSVQVASDFGKPKKVATGDGFEMRAEEARLAYVTVTRAKATLGRGPEKGGLSWIDEFSYGDVDLT